MLFLSLAILHVLVDFYFQPSSWIRDKNERREKSSKLFYHSVMHAVIACIPLLLITTDLRSIICMSLIIGLSHWLIDLWKTYMGNRTRFLIADQMLHMLVLLFTALHVSQLKWTVTELVSATITENNLAIAFGYVIIFKPTSILINSMLKKYTPEEAEEKNGLVSGGEVIGYLERTLVLTFIITGQYSVVGFILAAKSIFRFGELNNSKDHKLTEYVLLGSLLSVTITSMVGLIIKSILSVT
ncbi:MAG: DUF3307 domain-containing protein [Oceanisphaera sp.]|uniref:DUF3307 domain-containing protein n=1 Tax=Oceanisphaera sp. TaxID=1929979 RepID=UPI003C71E9B0